MYQLINYVICVVTKHIIDITFKVDLNGVINVIILDRKSNVEKNILIKDIPLINDDELENILNLAKQNEELDEEETLIKTRLYLIKNKIDIILNNLKLNELIQDNKKEEIVKEILELDNNADNATSSTILLNILKEIDDHYYTFTNVQNYEENNSGDDLNQIIIIEMKEELFNRVTLLLNKNPEWEEYLKPILDELNYNNVTKDYLVDKLETIKDLEDNEDETIDYKNQLNNLCLFLKSEIELENLDVPKEKIEYLSQLINETINIIEGDNDDVDWETKLNEFNLNCEEIYNLR